MVTRAVLTIAELFVYIYCKKHNKLSIIGHAQRRRIFEPMICDLYTKVE